jgi:hypothetical protein
MALGTAILAFPFSVVTPFAAARAGVLLNSPVEEPEFETNGSSSDIFSLSFSINFCVFGETASKILLLLAQSQIEKREERHQRLSE